MKNVNHLVLKHVFIIFLNSFSRPLLEWYYFRFVRYVILIQAVFKIDTFLEQRTRACTVTHIIIIYNISLKIQSKYLYSSKDDQWNFAASKSVKCFSVRYSVSIGEAAKYPTVVMRLYQDYGRSINWNFIMFIEDCFLVIVPSFLSAEIFSFLISSMLRYYFAQYNTYLPTQLSLFLPYFFLHIPETLSDELNNDIVYLKFQN